MTTPTPKTISKIFQEMLEYAHSLLNDAREDIKLQASIACTDLSRAATTLREAGVEGGWTVDGKLVPEKLPNMFSIEKLKEAAYEMFRNDKLAGLHRLQSISGYAALVELQCRRTPSGSELAGPVTNLDLS